MFKNMTGWASLGNERRRYVCIGKCMIVQNGGGFYGGIVRKTWGDMRMAFWERAVEPIVLQIGMRLKQFMEKVWEDQGRKNERKKERKRPILFGNWVRGVSDSAPVASGQDGSIWELAVECSVGRRMKGGACEGSRNRKASGAEWASEIDLFRQLG